MLHHTSSGMIALLACGLAVCSAIGASGHFEARQGRAMRLRRGGDRAWGAGAGQIGRALHRLVHCLGDSVECVLGFTAQGLRTSHRG